MQKEKLFTLEELYKEWNSKINLVSRKDIENLAERHILHSLAIVKIISFKAGTKIMDAGTGGGLPGIPLAIYFPNCSFTLVDSIGKKIRAASDIAEKLELKNVACICKRIEFVNEKFDFIIGRAVAPLDEFYPLVKNKILPHSKNSLLNGILYLKGNDSNDKIKGTNKIRIFPIRYFFEEEFFREKVIVHIS